MTAQSLLEHPSYSLPFRPYCFDVSCAQQSFHFFLGHILNFSQPSKAPGVVVVVKCNLIALIQDDIAWLCINLFVITGQGEGQFAHLFKTAVVMHLQGDRALFKFLHQCLGRGIARKLYSPHCIFCSTIF